MELASGILTAQYFQGLDGVDAAPRADLGKFDTGTRAPASREGIDEAEASHLRAIGRRGSGEPLKRRLKGGYDEDRVWTQALSRGCQQG